jgi:mono/diheme cytochrome c family protein
MHAGAARAQSAATTPATSTQSGVYTAEQAERGKNVYFGKCRSCHEPSTGDAFARLWGGKTVSDLSGYVLKSMPSNDPGTLDPYDNADVVAYLLRATGMPPGEHELGIDTDSLKAIRIDMNAKKDPPPQHQHSRAGAKYRATQPVHTFNTAK